MNTDFIRSSIRTAVAVYKVPQSLLSADVLEIVSRSMKAATDLSTVNARYHDAITQSLVSFFEGGNITTSRNAFKRATSAAFLDSFEIGYKDGGGSLPLSEDALSWLDARINTEWAYIGQLYEQAKALKKEEGFASFEWVSERADAYTNTLREIYNSGKLQTTPDQMVTFDGEDGAESCPDCQKLKGKRHKISWFVARNFVPPFGTGLECHPGRRCQHGLKDDKGNWLTI